MNGDRTTIDSNQAGDGSDCRRLAEHGRHNLDDLESPGIDLVDLVAALLIRNVTAVRDTGRVITGRGFNVGCATGSRNDGSGEGGESEDFGVHGSSRVVIIMTR